MDSLTSFKSLLATANFATRTCDAIAEFCCGSARELALLPSKDLDAAIANLHKSLSNAPTANNRVRINATKCILLHSIRVHCLDRINCNAEFTAASIRSLQLADINLMRQDYLDTTLVETEGKGLVEVTIPKLSTHKWIEFKTAMTECLGRTIGKNSIPFTYLIRQDDIGDFSFSYDNRTDRLIQCISLSGAAFKSDNSDLYSLLVEYTDNTEGYAIVHSNSRRRNGRKSWFDLVSHFEGATYKQRIAQEANSLLRNTTYSGPKKHFSFGDYYNRHSRAHVRLLAAGKPMTTEQQIDTFIQGVQCATTQSIIVSISGDPSVRTSFETYYNNVASRLELALSLTSKPSDSITRHVNQVSGEKSNGKRKSFSRHDKPNKRLNSDASFVPEARKYTRNEWKSLSTSQKNQVKALHRSQKSTATGRPSGPAVTSRALVPFQPRNDNTSGFYSAHRSPGLRQTNQMSCQPPVDAYHTFPHPPTQQPYHYINQVSIPPRPPLAIPPPPPPPRDSDSVSSSIDANSGSAGSSWGGYYGNT